MTLRTWDGPVEDTRDPAEVVESHESFAGRVWSVRTDTLRLADGQEVVRDVIAHPGAVGIVTLDEQERVLLVRQYRHPLRAYLWEPPAGLLDVPGEPPWETAKRELYEEAHLRADRWNVLADFFNSPGGSEESFRCFLARDLSEVDEGDRHEGDGEERDMPGVWVPLETAKRLVVTGALHNPTAVIGILSAWVASHDGWATLRPADAPWPFAPGS